MYTSRIRTGIFTVGMLTLTAGCALTPSPSVLAKADFGPRPTHASAVAAARYFYGDAVKSVSEPFKVAGNSIWGWDFGWGARVVRSVVYGSTDQWGNSKFVKGTDVVGLYTVKEPDYGTFGPYNWCYQLVPPDPFYVSDSP